VLGWLGWVINVSECFYCDADGIFRSLVGVTRLQELYRREKGTFFNDELLYDWNWGLD
jgi:hypothetical protein